MHVVQALAALNLGGSELVATELAEFLSPAHRVTVVAGPGALQERVEATGAEYLPWTIGRKRLSTLGYVSRFAAWLRSERPDIVHVHSRLPAWICRLALLKLKPDERPAFITSVHGHYSVSRYSAVMASGDRVIAVSNHIREYTLRNYPMADSSRLATIHGGTDTAVFRYGYQPSNSWWRQTLAEFPELRERRILCLPGRLSRYKGHATFIELVAALGAEFPDVHGVVVGNARPGSRFRSELEGLAERSGILNRITFTGDRTDIRDWMAASEVVFNLCSDPPEAFGRIVPEALHLGVPAIGWNHGGVQEVLEQMFPAGAVRPDHPAELLERARSFLRSRPVVAPSKAFLLEDSMNRTLRLYQSTLAGGSEESS